MHGRATQSENAPCRKWLAKPPSEFQIPDTATGCTGLMFTSMLTGWMLTGPCAKRRATANLRKGLSAQGLPHFAAWSGQTALGIEKLGATL